jgi:hypothetical protein
MPAVMGRAPFSISLTEWLQLIHVGLAVQFLTIFDPGAIE